MDNWSTNDELAFLDGMMLGRWTNYQTPKISEQEMLNNYIKCALHRKANGKTPNINWDLCIEKAELLKYQLR